MWTLILEKIKENKIVFGLLLIGTGLSFAFILFNQPAASAQAPSVKTLASSVTATSANKTEKEEIEKKADLVEETTIMVDVKGAVQSPGLYTLAADSRVDQAIKLAGGLLPEADPKSINLAQKLSDEAVIYVATQAEAISIIPSSATTSQTSPESTPTSNKLNLNTATISDLQTISGIGEKRAQDIIAFRESNGGFKSVDVLGNVSGIGDKTLENLRPYVTVE